jgi:hypothetical protein
VSGILGIRRRRSSGPGLAFVASTITKGVECTSTRKDIEDDPNGDNWEHGCVIGLRQDGQAYIDAFDAPKIMPWRTR